MILIRKCVGNVRLRCIIINRLKQRNYGPHWQVQHDGKDRWYLEALGIGADKQWDKFFTAYLAKVKDPLQTDAARDIVWRARTEKAVPYIAALASDNKTPIK